jgi:hypothetical protein
MKTELIPKPNRWSRLFILATATLVLSQPLSLMGQGVVTPKERRTALLNTLDTMLNPGEWQRDLSAWPDSPFHPPQVRKATGRNASADGNDQETEKEAPPLRLSDEEALERIARQVKPSGSIIFGQMQALQFPSGEMMRQGEVFRARIRDEVYEVTLVSVSLRDYTLQLGEARLNRYFESSTRSSQ